MDNSNTKEQLMDIKEVSNYLRLHEMTVRRYMKEGKIPFLRAGKPYRFRISDINKWLEKGSQD